MLRGLVSWKKGLRAQAGPLTGWATSPCFQGSASAAPARPVGLPFRRGSCCYLHRASPAQAPFRGPTALFMISR